MPANIELMLGSMKQGGLRSTHFDVRIFSPLDTSTIDDLPLKAKASSHPQSTLGQIPIYFFGRQIKEAGDREFPDWNVTFYADEDYLIRDFFERWSNWINAHIANQRTGGASEIPSSYKGSGIFRSYSKNGSMLKQYNLYGLWPNSPGEITNDWENSNQISTFDVTLTYDYWATRTTDIP